MKNLTLMDYGVHEMNHVDLVDTDGGILPLIIIGVGLLMAGCTQQNSNTGNHVEQSNTMTTHTDSVSTNTDVNVGIKKP